MVASRSHRDRFKNPPPVRASLSSYSRGNGAGWWGLVPGGAGAQGQGGTTPGSTGPEPTAPHLCVLPGTPSRPQESPFDTAGCASARDHTHSPATMTAALLSTPAPVPALDTAPARLQGPVRHHGAPRLETLLPQNSHPCSRWEPGLLRLASASLGLGGHIGALSRPGSEDARTWDNMSPRDPGKGGHPDC